jgi:hypothetical protein
MADMVDIISDRIIENMSISAHSRFQVVRQSSMGISTMWCN